MIAAAIKAIIAYLINNRIARFIGGALMAIASVLTFGAIKKREGAQAAKNKAAADALKDKIKREGKADEALTDEKRAGGDNADIVKRLHDRDGDW